MNIIQYTQAPKGEQCQCAACGLTFAGERAFDQHRTGKHDLPKGHPCGRRCRDVAEMSAIGMTQSAVGLWREARAVRSVVSELRTHGLQKPHEVPAGLPTGLPTHTPVPTAVRSSKARNRRPARQLETAA